MKLKGVENVILKSRMKEYELIEKLVEHLVERLSTNDKSERMRK